MFKNLKRKSSQEKFVTSKHDALPFFADVDSGHVLTTDGRFHFDVHSIQTYYKAKGYP